MKRFSSCCALIVITSMVGLVGCGSDEEAVPSTDNNSADQPAPETSQAEKKPDFPLPRIPPKRGPLEKLVIKDLEVGEGARARWGDVAFANYVGVYWETGKVFARDMRTDPYAFTLEKNGAGPGWQKGLHGMRVGGWRELRIPSDLLYGDGDAAYVVTLLEVEPRGKAQR
jgi:FKBP-type peptidyl-prolyl cis-trans isomerase